MSRERAGSVRSTPRPIFALSRRPMRKPGSARLRRKRSADAVVAGLAALLAWAGAASPEELPSYTIAADPVPPPLTGAARHRGAGPPPGLERRPRPALLGPHTPSLGGK